VLIITQEHKTLCVFLATDLYHFAVSSVAALLQTCEFITFFFNYFVNVVTLFLFHYAGC